MQARPVPFLRQVADFYLGSGFRNRIFVFPNRRSMAFFKKYIADALQESGRGPVVAPRMMGVNEFFSAMTGRHTSDRISLLLKLYDCYGKLLPGEESLDSFVWWGDSIISDFDEIDKYQVDASMLFANILDLKSLTGDLSFLTKEQREAVEKLSDHFLPENWDRAKKGIDAKERFIKVWSKMFDLYSLYRKSLDESGMAYEGMVYRDLAEKVKLNGAGELLTAMDPEAEGCVFVGLNSLNACEKEVLRALQRENLAEFCWDFPGEMIADPRNQASRFLLENLGEFRNVTEFDAAGLPAPEVHVVSVSSGIGQAKVVHNIIGETPENERGLDFAVVLPDESMLMPVLSSLPPVESVNVTMGYSLSSSEWNAMMRSIIALQLHLRDGKYFYHKQVSDILACAIIKGVSGEEGKECAERIRKAAKAYVPVADLQGCELHKVIFRPVVTNLTKADTNQVKALASYLCEVVEAIAAGLDKDMDSLHLECAYRYLQCMRRLAGFDLEIQPKTFAHMVEQLVAGVSVPFSGEPLGGLQVMGPLETRGLDFRHIVILNANEGTFPGRNSRPSNVPPELRKAFGLPTYDLQDSMWAYYFYRMIARAQDVWMIYDSRTEGMTTGEESRFVKQLSYLYADKCKVVRESASSAVGGKEEEGEIKKEQADVDKIKGTVLSASSFHRYLTCPAQFYYYVVKELYRQDEVSEDMDSGMIGNVCHDTLQAIYCCEEAMSPDFHFDKQKRNPYSDRTVGEVTEKFINGWLGREKDIKKKIESLVCQQIHSHAVEGRDLVAVEICKRYVMGVLQADLKLLKEHGKMTILGLEKKYFGNILGYDFKGYVDRLDTFEDGTVRVVDYKTGSDRQDVLDPENGADTIAGGIFNAKDGKTYKAAFQFYLYDTLTSRDKLFAGKPIVNSMYPMTQLFTDGVKVYPASAEVKKAVEGKLASVLAEIEDLGKGFARKDDNGKNCKYCDYAVLCGKLSEKNK